MFQRPYKGIVSKVLSRVEQHPKISRTTAANMLRRYVAGTQILTAADYKRVAEIAIITGAVYGTTTIFANNYIPYLTKSATHRRFIDPMIGSVASAVVVTLASRIP